MSVFGRQAPGFPYAVREFPGYPYAEYERGAGERSLGSLDGCCCSGRQYPVALTSGSGKLSRRHAGMEQSRLFMGELPSGGSALKYGVLAVGIVLAWRWLA